MKMLKSKTWQYEKSGTEKDSVLFGVMIFELKWTPVGETVKVKGPDYRTEILASVYEVMIDGQVQRFASTELSYGVYGFYLYKY